jgi:N-methylhydantoinase B
MVMDHGRTGPQGALGGEDGGTNTVAIETVQADGIHTYVPPHLSKDQDIEIKAGDRVRVSTPGGGGFGDPKRRDPALVARDVERGYYTPEQIRSRFGIAMPAAAKSAAE